MAATSLVLGIRWIVAGDDTSPTILAFTGFGHRLDPWQRLRAPGWRLGVLEFPIGTSPDKVWTAAALAAQLERFWGKASHRALLAFSFGAAPATAVSGVLAKAAQEKHVHLAAYVAPVQWGKAPWSLLRAMPVKMRLQLLRGVAKGSNSLVPLAGKLGYQTVRQFVHIVERYVGWDFVAHYLPYLDWIDSPRTTIEQWNQHPWPVTLFGASNDPVIPVEGMQSLAAKHTSVHYQEVVGHHFDAVDAARPHLLKLLSVALQSADRVQLNPSK